MMLEEALQRACNEVGIEAPRGRLNHGKWIPTSVLGDRRNTGDGRVICDSERVTAWNWKTGDKATVWLKEQRTEVDRKRTAQQIADAERERRQRADKAASIAQQLLAASTMATHAYLARKGFPSEQTMTLKAEAVREIGGKYLLPDAGEIAIVLAARIGVRVTSAQIIWEDGTKKFLAGGSMGGAIHRIASGRDTWLCEGFATGLSLRRILKGLQRADTILVCFSASNIAKVAATIKGRCFIAADHDKPMEQFGGIGTGEHFAKATGRPYLLPPDVGMDVNDMERKLGPFAVQKAIGELVRRVA